MKLDELQFRLEEASTLIRVRGGGVHYVPPDPDAGGHGGGSAAGTGVGLARQAGGGFLWSRLETSRGEAAAAGAGDEAGGGLGGGGGWEGVGGGEQGAGEGEMQTVRKAACQFVATDGAGR